LFQKCNLLLVDALGKNKRVDEVVKFGLSMVHDINDRVENVKGNFDFIVSRAVGSYDLLLHIGVKGKIKKESTARIEKNGSCI